MTQDEKILRSAAARTVQRPEFMGWIIAQYGEIEGLNEGQVREHLRVSSSDWPRLHLCLRPRAEHFLKDVAVIAGEFGMGRDILAAVIRKVEGLQVLATRADENQPDSGERQASDCPGHFLAARSRKKKPPRK